MRIYELPISSCIFFWLFDKINFNLWFFSFCRLIISHVAPRFFFSNDIWFEISSLVQSNMICLQNVYFMLTYHLFFTSFSKQYHPLLNQREIRCFLNCWFVWISNFKKKKITFRNLIVVVVVIFYSILLI